MAQATDVPVKVLDRPQAVADPLAPTLVFELPVGVNWRDTSLCRLACEDGKASITPIL